MPSYSLRNPDTGATCAIEVGRGFDYSIEAESPTRIEAALEQLLGIPGSQVAHGTGGMVNNINILENIALPAVYHGIAFGAGFERQVFAAFAECGLDEAQAETLCARRPGELAPLEQRLASFVRGLLMHPEVLVYSRFFEGLTRAEMERAAALNAVYRARHPDGTAVYLQLGDMPVLQPRCDGQFFM